MTKRRRAFFTIRSAEGSWKRPSKEALAKVSLALIELAKERGRKLG